jgi:hypothetical protein
MRVRLALRASRVRGTGLDRCASRLRPDGLVPRVSGVRITLRTLLAATCLLAACHAETELPAADFADAESPQELVALVAGTLARVERLSGLDRVAPLRMRWQTREGARDYVAARLAEEMPPERLDGVRRTYAALGLLPDTLDLRALLLDLYTEQVLGYYDPRAGALFVIRGVDDDALRPVLIHELVHALQDQHTDIDALVSPERGNDRQTAAHAALEGHAMIVMFAALAELAARRALDPAALPNPAGELGPALAAQNEAFPVFRRAPAVIRETLLFPYIHGADFVHRLWQSMPDADRYPAPIDTLLPQSTAQVLRPVERFIESRTEPVELRFDLPADWRVLRDDTFGQLETAILLGVHLGAAHRAAADGWAGDRHVLVELAGVGDVLYWASVWESDAEADRFADAVRRAASARATRNVLVDRGALAGRPAVLVTDAPAAAAQHAAPLPGAAPLPAVPAMPPVRTVTVALPPAR